MTSDSPQHTAEVVAASATRGGTLRRLWRFSRKELRESLRDRRTLITLMLMPLLVYPLLGTVVQKFAFSSLTGARPRALVMLDLKTPTEEIQLLASEDSRTMEARYDPRAQSRPTDGDPAETSAASMESVAKEMAGLASTVELEFSVYGAEGDRLDLAVRNGDADVAIRRYPAGINPESGRPKPPVLEVISRQGDAFSASAAQELERRIIASRDRMVRFLLRQSGISGEAFPAVTRTAVASQPGRRSMLLGAFIPLVLVLMTMTGAVYPAIDLTAGERERGTLEMLIASPASRRELLIGKFIAVCTIAIMTAIINLTAMLITVYSIGFDHIVFSGGVTFGTLLQVLLLLIVFASFFSAVLLSVTSVARSFREAQAWIVPLMLMSLAPGILSLMPNVSFSLPLAFVPLVNIVLLGRDLFQGQAALLPFVVTLAATLGFTLIALRVAGSVFGSDAGLAVGAPGIAELWNRPMLMRPATSLPAALACFGVLVPLYLVFSGLRGRIVSPENMTHQMLYSGAVTLVLFAGLPAVFAVWQRVDLRTGFALTMPGRLPLLGALLLGISLWPFAYESLLFLRSHAMEQLLGEKAAELVRRISETPLWLRLGALAVLPAVCEEFFFRGFLLTSLSGQGAKPAQSVLITSALFAALHVIVDQALMLERFVPSFLLGVVLALIRLRTGSLIPGIVLHLAHNSLLLSLSDLTPLLRSLQLDLEGESHLPLWFLGVAAVIACAGVLLVRIRSPRPVAGLRQTVHEEHEL